MVVDVDNYQIELVIARDKKMLFSRNFKLNRLKPDWEGAFIDEINKSRDAYLKEVGREAPSKIAILGAEKLCQLFAEVLKKQLTLPIKILSTSSKLRFSNNLSNDILNSDNSFTALIGLGLSGIEESINLLPQNIKERNFRLSQRKSQLRLISLMGAIILIWVFAIARNLDNKARYLKQLKLELSKISQEARPLEEFEKRFQLLESRLKKKPSTLDIIHELYQVIPEGVSLTNLSYDEDKEIILRGTTPELNYVFKFASQLENSAIFSKFNIKVRYATKKKTQAGEIVDYEIVCLKKS
jgi:Tfp pilus assembly protein PilN